MSEEDSKPIKHSSQFKWLLISVAGNLFLAGLLVGSWLAGPPRGGLPPRPPFQMMVHEVAGKVSPEGAKKLSDLADELEGRFMSGMAKSAGQREHIRQQLVREPFDPDQFLKALDALNSTFSEGRNEANRRFAQVIATLSPGDRKALATVRFP